MSGDRSCRVRGSLPEASLWLVLAADIFKSLSINRSFIEFKSFKSPKPICFEMPSQWKWVRSLHYRLRAIRGVPLGVINFTPHFIDIQIFQILFLPPVSFYTHPNISNIFVGDEIGLFTLAFHDIYDGIRSTN